MDIDTVATESLLGASYGLLLAVPAGVVIAVAAIGVRYGTRRRIPHTASVPIALALAVVTGYSIGVFDVDPLSAETVRLVTALLVVAPIGAFAGRLGWRLATELPLERSLPLERGRTLSADAIDAVDAMGQVTIRADGDVSAFEGYPPLDPSLRTALETDAWRLPADLPLSELEVRLEDRLRTTYDLEAASVTVDPRGRATITVAPPSSGVSRRVPEGWRAVSVSALLPTGLRPGDDVLAVTDSESVAGTVVSTTDGETVVADGGAATTAASGVTPSLPSAPSAGGEGRLTIAVPTTDAEALLEADHVGVVATPGETTPELEAISLLERDGTAIRTATVTDAIVDAVEDDDSALRIVAVRGAGTSRGGTNRGETTRGETICDNEPSDGTATTSSTDSIDWTFDPDPDAITVGTEAILLGDDGTVLEYRADEPDRQRTEAGR
ncbi:hypothetical protein [Natronolimnohabitans innermongolicus]|uniref:RCK C-terminal domain-containing protein n=1 Tax=Natronolimnohabitans innermongolicus JCM 12255 TaxID=1227499 RepID=L9X5F1_9EURY|nr:hypothetical protein [Natronolimnohabitans innermongolicus]ELY56691.1 hypothetical protein C493_09965 [Natronolimnohabitans innermongolicus JCM 12255]